jgi:CubicO group peptidase (beta-lactamase class C family)
MMKRPALIVAFVALAAARLQPWPRAAALYFPPAAGEWAHVQPHAAGWDERALDAALDYAGRTNSTGVVVLQDGRILAERRWPVRGPEQYRRLVVGKTAGGDVVEDVASVQKSVVAFLIGVAQGKRLIDLEAPVSQYLGNGWSKANEEAEFAITVRHLMTMTSGLNDSGDYQAPAGQTWRYNTGTYSKLIGILEKAADADIDKLTTEWLTTPAGMSDSKWVRRTWSAGNDAANSIGFATTPRDLARFGLLVLAKGSWNGRDLLHNSNYLERMLRPSQDLNPSYGLLWWLNGQARVQHPSEAQARPGSLTPNAPRDLVAAQGAQDRKCFVVPSLGLVVTRLGAPTGTGSTLDLKWDDEFWKLLMKAAPAAVTK